MRAILFVLNNFAHDLLTGLWLCAFLVLAVLQTESGAAANAAAPALQRLTDLFFWLQQGSLAGVALTGVLRYLDNRRGYSAGLSAAGRTRILLGKHILLGGVFSTGTILALLWR